MARKRHPSWLDSAELQLWGGIECTINRIHATFRHQLDETGHSGRLEDIALLTGIGLAAIRYPVLWEQVSPDSPFDRNWTWHDDRLGPLRAAGLSIIAGLVHHGSGPRYTDLLDPSFAPGLADHARAVAQRYPFITDWTPVNEPVTTARFSALYGHWFPHVRDERSFWIALLNQVDATRLAMRAVREITPGSRLIQTDDLGRTYATAPLRDQAGFDNSRRWMGWDLLCGLVTPGHAFWRRLCDYGLEARLRVIAADPCPPDIVGINHYLTSDRFLDRGPHARAAQSGVGPCFADSEAIRVLDPPPRGLAGAVAEAWDRYRIPIAITEVHNGSTREEQMRWMASAWAVAEQARHDGVDVRAVTSWALLGSSGWDTLLTRRGRYEPGAYHVGGDRPRPTALLPLLRGLAEGHTSIHPVLNGPGWWRRPIRFHYRPISRPAPMRDFVTQAGDPVERSAPPILIAGADGTLGGALAAACRHRGIAHVALGRPALDLASETSIVSTLDRVQPWAVINAAGWVRVDDAEEHEAGCWAINADGAERLASACANRDIRSVHFSSDLVFDGRLGRAYLETDAASPLNAYGRSKAAAEQRIAALVGHHLIVRTAAFFSPFDPHNFAIQTCRALCRGDRFGASDTHIVTPTYVPDLCDAVLDLVIDGERGIWHLTNGEACSWADFGRRIAKAVGLNADLVEPRDAAMLGWRAPRPRHVPLASRHGQLLPCLDDAISRFARDQSATPAGSHPIAATAAIDRL